TTPFPYTTLFRSSTCAECIASASENDRPHVLITPAFQDRLAEVSGQLFVDDVVLGRAVKSDERDVPLAAPVYGFVHDLLLINLINGDACNWHSLSPPLP